MHLQSLNQACNTSYVFCACAAFIFMSAAKKDFLGKQRGSYKQSACALGSMALVPADCHQICLKLMDVLDGFLAEPLHGIGVKKDAVIAA